MRIRRAAPALAALALSLSAFCPASAVEARLPRHPAPSPDGKLIAFSWQGDIWTVPVAGGTARRMTVHPAYDRFPVWSRDGRWIAFSSDRHGNADVFVMAADGSANPTRLTYVSTPDAALDFTPDGAAVLFSSRRDDSVRWIPSLYTVPVGGGSARRAQSALGSWGSYSPDGKRLVFVRGVTPWTRRGYRGAANRDLWLREADGSLRRLTTFDGDDDCPTWVDDHTIAFLSARSGRKNVFLLDLTSNAQMQLTYHDGSDVRFPRAAANGSIIAYEFEDRLWVVRPTGGAPHAVAIDVPSDRTANATERRTARDGASELALAPDGKTVAFVVAGDVFVTAVRSKDDQDIAAPPTVQVTATVERERDVRWAPDGKSLVFASAREGQQLDLYVARRGDETQDWTLNYEFPVTRLTSSPEDDRDPKFSPDGKRLAWVRGAGELVVANADGSAPKPLALHWSPPEFAWSPDGRWVAYSFEDQHSNTEIWVAPSAGGTPYNVSRHPNDDVRPSWSPDGRRLFWLSRRHARTLDVWGVWLTRTDYERQSEEWLRVWKSKDDPKKDEPRKDDPKKDDPKKDEPGKTESTKDATGAKKDGAGKKDDKPAKDEKTKPVPEVVIDFDRLWERAQPLTEFRGDEGAPLAVDGGKRIVFTSEHEGERDLYSIRWDGKDVKRLTNGGKNPTALVADGQTVFFLDGKGSVQRVGLDGKSGDPVPFTARYEVNVPALRTAVFEEAWRTLGQWFYDPEFHGVDWAAQRAKYRPWAVAASATEDFSDVLNLMIDELNASHLAYRPKANPGGEVTGWIGALFDPAAGGPGVLVREVLRDSPAARRDVNLAPGERLLAVQGRTVSDDLDVYALFTDTVGQRVPLRVRGTDGKERTVVVTPVNLEAERDLRYEQWTAERRALVEKLSNGRLGYIHIQGMDMESFEKFERDLFAAADGRDGLVIDVRTNGGGWTTDYLLAVLEVQRHAATVPRGAPRSVKAYPQDRLPLAAWTKPALTLCNEESYSNAEIFSHAFKTLKRGTLVGTRTFGAVISTDGTTLLDGALLRLPTRGWYRADTGANEENDGAVPDVAVEQPPSQDADPLHDAQLEKAVAVFLEQLGKDPRHGAW